MRALRHFGDQLFHDDIEHRARGEAQKIRQRRNDERRGEYRQHRADRLDDAREHAAPESSCFAHALGAQRERNDRPLGKILDRDAE